MGVENGRGTYPSFTGSLVCGLCTKLLQDEMGAGDWGSLARAPAKHAWSPGSDPWHYIKPSMVEVQGQPGLLESVSNTRFIFIDSRPLCSVDEPCCRSGVYDLTWAHYSCNTCWGQEGKKWNPRLLGQQQLEYPLRTAGTGLGASTEQQALSSRHRPRKRKAGLNWRYSRTGDCLRVLLFVVLSLYIWYNDVKKKMWYCPFFFKATSLHLHFFIHRRKGWSRWGISALTKQLVPPFWGLAEAWPLAERLASGYLDRGSSLYLN